MIWNVLKNNTGFYPFSVSFLELAFNNELKYLDGKDFFYPCCGRDATLELVQKDGFLTNSVIYYNDDEAGTDEFEPKENPLAEVVDNYIIGDCNKVYESIDYEVLYLCDAHNVGKKVINKADYVFTCSEGHIIYYNILRSFKLDGVFNRGLFLTENLENYEILRPYNKLVDLFKAYNKSNIKSSIEEYFEKFKDTSRMTPKQISKIPTDSSTFTIHELIFKDNSFLYFYKKK
jgi:hypothetical protein